MLKKSLITFLIYIGIFGLMILVNTLFPSNVKYAPSAGILVFWGLLVYNPIALIGCIYKMIRGDKERLISLLIHGQILLFLVYVFSKNRIDYYF